MAWAIGIWGILISIVGVNLSAAGVVAILHAWRSKMRRGGRIFTAAAMTGLLPASLMIPTMLPGVSAGAEAPVGLVVAFFMVLGMVTVVSLPGALIVARKLEAPGDEFRVFE